MSNTHTFMTAGVEADDAQLSAMIRSSLSTQPSRDRSDWLKQVELGLDGYGERHRDTVERIRAILRVLALDPDKTAPAPVDAPEARTV